MLRPNFGAIIPELARPSPTTPFLAASNPRMKGSKTMSDEEKKKNGEYEKPESHEMEGDDLEDVSAGVSNCNAGGGPWGDPVVVTPCRDGYDASFKQCKKRPGSYQLLARPWGREDHWTTKALAWGRAPRVVHATSQKCATSQNQRPRSGRA